MLNLTTLNACAWPTPGRVNAAAIRRAGTARTCLVMRSSSLLISVPVSCPPPAGAETEAVAGGRSPAGGGQDTGTEMRRREDRMSRHVRAVPALRLAAAWSL